MSTAVATPADTTTLYDLRTARKMKHQDVVSAIATHTGEPAKHWTASVQYERRGVQDIDIIEALSTLYNLPVEQVKRAAKNSRLYGQPEEVRRPRRPQ